MKKEGPALSPWVQGIVERTIQTIKEMCKTAILQYESRDWPSKLGSIVDTYNNKIHSTIGMTPCQAWESSFSLDPTTLSNEKRLERIQVINLIRNRITAAGERYRRKFMEKNPVYVEQFETNEIVLVRVPKKYRSSIDYLWGRKAKLIEQLKSPNGELLNYWKVQWLETGGIRKNEKPFSTSNYFMNARDLKHFTLGNDIYLESNCVDNNDDTNLVEKVDQNSVLKYDENEDYICEEEKKEPDKSNNQVLFKANINFKG